ncbi:acyl-CoA dehydrogenase [Thalassobacter stenotrophicus]|uniref:acyl-CoA dehydrogenase family protein n=1 Tax=Thalassobacter stenotrophicus TaxID=266809 RepID=UPI0022A976EA|nr:acyl-CoA dehydrogenase [Thalassobacter stenotrophicus]UYP69168.1 acyl-CoA dehydrogenase [Thalassobacter stenotrophicus]
MDFTHTEERQMVVDTLARYIQNEYNLSDRNDAAASTQGFRDAHWNNLAELGMFGAFFTEEQGGFGGSAFDVAAVFQELGRGLVVEPLLDCVLRSGHVLAAAGDFERLAKVITGASRYVVAQAHTTSDRVTAKQSEAGWILNGTAPMVKFAAGADTIILSAQSGADAAQASFFLIDPTANGVAITHHDTFDGGSASDIHFADLAISSDALLGSAHHADTIVRTAENWACLAICAEALGIMEAIKETTLDYLRTRTQFGTVIGRFQALQHRMAQVLLEIEQARSAVINAAAAMNKSETDCGKALSAAKYSIGRIGTLVAEEAIQLHGGIGMTWEYEMGHFAKRLVMIDHEMGNADHHLARYMQFDLV